MDYKKSKQQVTAVVPIYNEINRIGKVLNILANYPGFAEVIVIDDGSLDNSSAVIAQFSQVHYVRKEINQGKAKAMDDGVKLVKTDIVFFCDGDIKGLKSEMLDKILEPVLSGRVDMFIAMRNHKIYFLHQLVPLMPLLGGERALTVNLWKKVPVEYKQRFKIESGLNFYAKYYGNGFDIKLFRDLSQTIKEKKYGYWNGFKKRLSMFVDILSAAIKLQLTSLPKDISHIRVLLSVFLFSFLLFVAGLFLLFIIHIGPLHFISNIFADELKKDSKAPFVNFLINLVLHNSRRVLLLVTYTIIISNLLIIITNIIKLISHMQATGNSLMSYFRKTKL